MQTGTYGSDKNGLICGYVFEDGAVGRPLALPDAVAWLRGTTPKAPGDFVWLHFNLADAAAEAWIQKHLEVVPEFFEALHDRLAAEAAADDGVGRPSWGFLLTMALIGGGPTFVGTAIGHGFTSEAVSVVFLTLAAGSIIYVVCQLVGIASRAKRTDILAYGLLVGLLAGFITDAIVTAAGA